MEKSYSNSKNYFPNLDGLRFIGSLIIIIFHIEDIKFINNRPTFSPLRYYNLVGNMDVSLFFVLSGFLITFLLLKEKKDTGDISLKSFYTKRALRIWPLYFLIVIAGFFILPHICWFNEDYSSNIYKHFWPYFIATLLFLSPFVRSASGLPRTIGPIWSVGVEEFFYLCWPVLLKITKKYLVVFFSVALLVLFVRNALLLGDDFWSWRELYNTLFRFVRGVIMQYRISCMAIGGIGAYWVVFEKNKILKLIYRKDIQWATYIITIGLLLLKIGIKPIAKENFPSIYYEIYSVLFMVIIVNLATNPRSILNLDYKWMNYLGKISYGLYMYHPILRIFSLRMTESIFKREISGWQMNLMLYAGTLIFTIIIAIISYEFFEKGFLKLKSKFA
ncbi:MAG TPA: acyltransferase [Bacteroidia bacterium]|jgi:peptidoglycan/LPS O-acetylase OafA/YrhL|nr:acyltransferase [Bacteroidia bacterium]